MNITQLCAIGFVAVTHFSAVVLNPAQPSAAVVQSEASYSQTVAAIVEPDSLAAKPMQTEPAPASEMPTD